MTNKKPYAYCRVIDKMKLPEQYHKTKKIYNAQRQEIRALYNNKTLGHSYRSLASLYNVSFGVIQVILNPKAKEQQARAGKAWRLKTGYKNTPSDSMELRRRKKQILITITERANNTMKAKPFHQHQTKFQNPII